MDIESNNTNISDFDCILLPAVFPWLSRVKMALQDWKGSLVYKGTR